MSLLQLAPASPKRAPLRIRLDRAITVRAVAIIGVVLFHGFTVPYGASGADVDVLATKFGAAARETIRTIWSGLPGLEQLVAVFFLISGYFSYRAYQRSRAAHTNRSRRRFVKFFLWRRFWRLVPAFWVALLFSYFVSFDHPFTWDGLRKLAVNASLLKTLYPGYFWSINYAHWYVAVQWQLDLLYPVFLYIVARRSAGFAVAVAWAASILFVFVVPHFSEVAYIRNLPFRWWAEWSLGVYLAHRHLAGVRLFPQPHWWMLGAVVALAAGRIGEIRFIEWFAVRIFLASAFEGLLLSRSPRWELERRLAPIGICSYSLYLLHIPVQQLVARGLRAVGASFSSLAVWAVFAVVSFALAFWLAKWSAEYIERKSSSLGNRIFRRRFSIRRWMRMHRSLTLRPAPAIEPSARL